MSTVALMMPVCDPDPKLAGPSRTPDLAKLNPFLVTELAIKLFQHIDSRTYWSARQVCSLWNQVGKSHDARQDQVNRIRNQYYLDNLLKYKCWESPEGPDPNASLSECSSLSTGIFCKCHDNMGFKFRNPARYWSRWAQSDESLKMLESLLFTNYDLYKTMSLKVTNGILDEFYDERCRFTSYRVQSADKNLKQMSAQVFILPNGKFVLNTDRKVDRDADCRHPYTFRRISQSEQDIFVVEFTPSGDKIVYHERLDDEWEASSSRLFCDGRILMVQKDQSLLQDDLQSPLCEMKIARLDTSEEFVANYLSICIEEDLNSLIIYYNGGGKIKLMTVAKNTTFDEIWLNLNQTLKQVGTYGEKITLWNPRVAKRPICRKNSTVWYGKWSYKLCNRCSCNEWLFELEVPQTENRRLIKCPNPEMYPFDFGLTQRQPPNEPCKQYYTGATVYRIDPDIMQSPHIKDIDFYPGRFLKPPGVQGHEGDLNFITGRMFAHRVTDTLLNVYELRQRPPESPAVAYKCELASSEDGHIKITLDK